MVRNLFWLTLSFAIIVCGTGIRSEANEITSGNGISLAEKAGNGHAGGSGGSSSCGGQSRTGATENGGQRIPKPTEHHRSKGKGKFKKGKRKKRTRKSKKRGCKKSSSKKRRKRKIRSLSIEEKEKLLKNKKRGCPAESELVGNRSEEPIVADELKIINERLDDIPLLLGIMKLTGIDQVIDKHIPVHWKQRDLSQGRTCIIWLAYILSEGDHRKVAVREYVRNMQISLSEITGREINELDFTDDRCGILLKNLSKRENWVKLEKELSERTIEAYELPKKTVRCDATTVSGYHRVDKEGLFQRGVSKDDPNRPQVKIMTGTLDPLGMSLASDTVSGERADDGLYRPLIRRMNEYLRNDDVLYVGDCKISAFKTRLYIRSIRQHYMCPLPMTGNRAKQMKELIRIGVMKEKQGALNFVYAEKKNAVVLMAKGYEFQHMLSGEYEGEKTKWSERMLIVNSPTYAKSQARGLEKRLLSAAKKLYALTPQRGPGKRQITDVKKLKTAIADIFKRYKVEGLLKYKYVKETERIVKYNGKGRGAAKRTWKITERVRYEINTVKRRGYRIKREKERLGWKLFVTDASPERLSFEDVVKCYRKEYRVERVFTRLKSRLNISPLNVKKKDQIVGMTNLLSLAVRVMTLAQYTVRRSLRKDQAKLKGLHSENPKKLTDTPTAERLLKAFSKITLTIIKSANSIKRHLTPLTHLQKDILKRVGLNCSIYKDLEFEKSPSKLSEW